MSSQDQALPAISHPETLDDVGAWFWRFLKTELTPYPGRVWVVGRITIAATIVTALIMTFRIPYGFLGALSTFFVSRENPAATPRGSIEMAVVSAAAALYTIVGVMTMVDDPLTHFLWIAASCFLAFYVIHIVPDYPAAAMFGGLLAVPIPIWDDAVLTVSERTENTLWLSFSVVVGAAVTLAVEYVFHRMHPVADLTLGIESRLRAVEDVLRRIAADLFRRRHSGKGSLPLFGSWHFQAAPTVAQFRLPAIAHRADERSGCVVGTFGRSCRRSARCSHHSVRHTWSVGPPPMFTSGGRSLQSSL